MPSAFSSIGDAFASHNKVRINGAEFPLDSFPPPAELWQRYKIHRGIEDNAEALVVQPYHLDASEKEPRYYQVEAIKSFRSGMPFMPGIPRLQYGGVFRVCPPPFYHLMPECR